jgi:CPA2 family monovalent cation:H+ antiporter-2
VENFPFLLAAGLMLGAFFAVSFASQKFRLPSVLIYIALGAAVSVLFSGKEMIHVAAEIGIVLLFFILGLEFPLARMMSIARRIWSTGLLDVGLNLGGAMALAMLFGVDAFSAFVLGSVAYATSSSIAAKLLDESKRLASPEAEFILALLIFEDLVAPVLVSFIAGIQSGDEVSGVFMGVLFLKIVLLAAGATLMGHFGFSRLNVFIGKYLRNDFMPLLAVGLALGYAGVAMALGLSEILGAFLAGVMLSETGRSPEIEHLLQPIRDLCLPFFFFWFGTTIHFAEGIPLVGLMIALVLWGMAGKIVTGYAGGRWFGLSPKVACRAACSLVPRGEFSAIIASLALPQLRIFSGVYIVITAFVGVYLFGRSGEIANWYQRKWIQGPVPAEAEGTRRSEV